MIYCLGIVKVSMLTQSGVDLGSSIAASLLSMWHLWLKVKTGWQRIQDNVSELCDISTSGLLFQ